MMQETPREDGLVVHIYVFPKGVERGMPGSKKLKHLKRRSNKHFARPLIREVQTGINMF